MQKCLSIYREQGLEAMLERKRPKGRTRLIPKWAEEALAKRLQEAAGFRSCRFGLKTMVGRLITACGVKPIGQWQWLLQAFWLYGAVEPATGAHSFLEFSHVDTVCFQKFLDAFAQTYCDSINILQLDRGRFHTAKALQIPKNVIILLQPPYCPELNPIERLWEELKRDLRWQSFQNLDQLWLRVAQLLTTLTPELMASITGFPFILDALSVANLI